MTTRPDVTSRSATELGSLSIETVLLTPILVALMTFGVYAGRIGQLELRLSRAVHDAARAGSVELDADTAAPAIDQVLLASLGPGQYERCVRDVTVDDVGYGPSGASNDYGS